MAFTLDALLTLLDLERIEHNIFREQSVDIGSGAVYGGQALAQSLVAAARTLDDPERICHSMHGYFILPGDVDAPIVYEVDRLRDGKSFTTRRIVAIQHGRAIFNMAASFQRPEDGHEHQSRAPHRPGEPDGESDAPVAPGTDSEIGGEGAAGDVPGPEDLPSELELIREVEDRIPADKRPFYTRERPIEFRPVDPANPFDPQAKAPVRRMWFRARGSLADAGRDDPRTHRSVLAYASDYGLLGTALRPHALSFVQPNLQLASLDHAIWFHRPVRVDEWLLYAMDSPSASGARGFTRGEIFTQTGTLVASVAQEGLMRVRG
jgi:acyl-CoA thioesterase-2